MINIVNYQLLISTITIDIFNHQSILSTIAINIFNHQSIISITAINIFYHQSKNSTIAIDFWITSSEIIPLLTDMASHRLVQIEQHVKDGESYCQSTVCSMPNLCCCCGTWTLEWHYYGKPNVATFNITIFIQFNPYSFNLIFLFIQFNPCSFNSIPIVILFNPYSFNSIFRSIQFNFLYSFDSISILVQFNFCIQSISIFNQFNFYFHLIQLLYSFNSVRLCSLNLYTHLFNLGVWVKGKFWAGSWDLYNKDGGGNAWGWRFPEVKSFFEHVISRTKEI